MNDPDGGYHIQYPDGHVSHAGRPDNGAPGSRTLFLYDATHPTVATTICYIVGGTLAAVGIIGLAIIATPAVIASVGGAATAVGAGLTSTVGPVATGVLVYITGVYISHKEQIDGWWEVVSPWVPTAGSPPGLPGNGRG